LETYASRARIVGGSFCQGPEHGRDSSGASTGGDGTFLSGGIYSQRAASEEPAHLGSRRVGRRHPRCRRGVRSPAPRLARGLAQVSSALVCAARPGCSPLVTALLAKAQEKGLQESLQVVGEIARARVGKLSDGSRRAFVFLSPPLNNSGAPQILKQIVDEFATSYGSDSVRLLAPPAPHEHPRPTIVHGVRVERAAAAMGQALVGLQLALRKDDFVLMNTVAVSRNYVSFVLDALRTGRLAHAYWYIHEDVEQLPSTAPFLLEAHAGSSIGRLVTQGRLTVVVPSKQVKAEYDRLLGTPNTMLMPFKIDTDRHIVAPRPLHDYATVKFLISGKPTDGRKGHAIALAAFHEFMKAHYDRDPAAYRPFTLTLVGMTDDYIAQQICSIGSTILGKRFEVFSSVSHETSIELTRTCNAVICCSFNEALPLYVIEGMCAGHLVLRNDSAGMEEQLDEGVNGFRIDSNDVRQVARVIERVLNKRTMTDERLQAMGSASQQLVARLCVPSYVDALEQARARTIRKSK